jgi:GNAT superfamily N-acetyltransferase
MVLVHPDFRRRGLGRQLLLAGIEYLEGAGVGAVKLDATPMGKRLYDTIGFVDEYGLERWTGQGRSDAVLGPDMRELTPADLEALVAFDTPIFGADRRRVLRRVLSEPAIRAAGTFAASGEVEGYVAVRPGQNAMYIGPLLAHRAVTAAALWRWARGIVGPRPVYVDVLLPNPTALELVRESGFTKQRELIRMYRGTNLSPGRPDLQYGILGPEVG